ncbi:hypothetical protein I656_01705 [Geobacillus sp. WSUCF1]|nr:hypothetical protein I656_01705 [Geobacillus sp. WSUCF1]
MSMGYYLIAVIIKGQRKSSLKTKQNASVIRKAEAP